MDNLDLEAAAKAGLISEDQALKLRNFHAVGRGETAADQERFGAIDGLSDIMTAFGLFLAIEALLAAISFFSLLLALPIAVFCWWLAKLFTLRRKLALTSVVLFLSYMLSATIFGFAVVMFVTGRAELHGPAGLLFTTNMPFTTGTNLATGLIATAAGVLYWRRFQLPFAYAVTLYAATYVLTQFAHLMLPDDADRVADVAQLLSGLLFFAVAMAWDISDVRRETRRADVGFWLHVFAGYLLASGAFKLVFDTGSGSRGWDGMAHSAMGPADSLAAMAMIGITLLFALVALAIDRRSLLLSSLGYAVPAVSLLAGASFIKTAMVSALAIGVTLAVTAAFWRPLRKFVLKGLPEVVRAQVPRTDLVYQKARPVT